MKHMISIVIPTYNEKENIKKLILKIFQNLENPEIIVIDDNSTDGTSDVVKKLIKKYNVRLIERSKKIGIGSAYKRGFRVASGDIIIQMDADLSHDPLYLRQFIEKINQGYDIVIGSRYIKNGKITGWSKYRKLLSKVSNFLAYLLLKIPVNDVTTGFRAYKKNFLNKINLDEINSNGYSFNLEILFRSLEVEGKIVEIPIIFKNRRIGKSKLGNKEIFYFLMTILRLMFHLHKVDKIEMNLNEI